MAKNTLSDSQYNKALYAKPSMQITPEIKNFINYITPYMNTSIKKAENNPNNFGVLSEQVNSPDKANKVLNSSIRNNAIRWIQAGMPGKFVDFMQSRWAPIGVSNDPHNLNANWAPNVRSFLEKQLGTEDYNKWRQMDLAQLQNNNSFA